MCVIYSWRAGANASISEVDNVTSHEIFSDAITHLRDCQQVVFPYPSISNRADGQDLLYCKVLNAIPDVVGK